MFVLLPGGTFLMGATPLPGDGPDPVPNYDPEADASEGPVHEVTLDPFFMSKFEMTQAQWLRATESNPSDIHPDLATNIDFDVSLRDPVENISWFAATAVLARLDLVIPTEAQWEYAARAGTTTPWYTGDDRDTLKGHCNILEFSGKRAGMGSDGVAAFPGFNDGFGPHAPVGSFKPNPFGLHDVIGNVVEWCREPTVAYTRAARPGDGLRDAAGGRTRAIRGSSFEDVVSATRLGVRRSVDPTFKYKNIGVRPARPLARPEPRPDSR